MRLVKRISGVCVVIAVFVLSVPSVWALETRQYVQYIQSESFSLLEDELTRLENSKEKDTDGMSVFHRTMNRISYDLSLDPEPSLVLLNKWCEQRQSYLSYLLRGVFYIDFAWADRGNKFADKVLPEAWDAFKKRLELGRDDLLKAAELNPNSAEPWVALMTAYRGLSAPLKIEECFQKATAIDPKHFGAYQMMLTAKMEKWFGTNEEMFEFARKTYGEHKDDPVFAFLLIEANDELAKRMALRSDGKRSDYYKVPVNYTAVRSLIDEVRRVYPKSLKAMTWSATIEYFVGNYAAAFKETQSMGNEVDEDIWGKKDSYLQTKAWLQRQKDKGVF